MRVDERELLAKMDKTIQNCLDWGREGRWRLLKKMVSVKQFSESRVLLVGVGKFLIEPSPIRW